MVLVCPHVAQARPCSRSLPGGHTEVPAEGTCCVEHVELDLTLTCSLAHAPWAGGASGQRRWGAATWAPVPHGACSFFFPWCFESI